MGGNSGMNTHLSEILSWLLEPLATSMIGDSSEVISGEDLKSKMDSLNNKNKEWTPEEQMEEPIGESSLMEGRLEGAPSLCGCEECKTEASLGGEECVNTQTGSVGVAAPQSNTLQSPSTSLEDQAGSGSSKTNSHQSSSQAECGSSVEYITSSVQRRGNRNKAMLIREKRELLKQRRTNAYKRCNKVSSKDVPKEYIQDRSRVMVVIGTDAVSLYPSLVKREAADEVAEAVTESSMKWEGVNWKEATRFLVLGRDEAWCRSSGLQRILPKRRFKHGVSQASQEWDHWGQ